MLPLFAFASATRFIAANSITNALARRPDRAGAVSALVGAAQYGAGVASSALVGAFADGTPWPMGWVIAAAGLGSALSSWALSRRLPDTSLVERSTNMTQRTWLICSVSSGFGREMTEQLLQRGDRVVGTVRKRKAVAGSAEQYPEKFRAELLDVTDAAATKAMVDRAFGAMGRIDVVISNAGYGLFGAAEELSDAQVRADDRHETSWARSNSSACGATAPAANRGADASSRFQLTAAKSHIRGNSMLTMRPSGVSKASWSRSHRKSRCSASA